jgi:DNA (cytosine-5)-methyltransferase 1
VCLTVIVVSKLMNENQPSNNSRIQATSSKRGSRKLSASARKQKKKQGGRVSEFTKIINNGHQPEQQRLPHSHSSGAASQQEGSLGNDGGREDVMSFLDNAVHQQQQTALENETTSSEGVFTQDFRDVNLDAILQDYNNSNSAKESSCSEGRSSRLTQDMMSSSTIANSASLTETAVAQANTKNEVKNNSNLNQEVGRTQQPLSRMGSLDSAASKPSPLTAEMKEKIEANRQRALRRKRLRQQTMNQQSPSNEVAQKPHPREEAMRPLSEEIETTSATVNPSQASRTSSTNGNAQIASQKPSHYAHHPLEEMRNSEETDMTSAETDPSQESVASAHNSNVQMEGLSFYYDEEEQKEQNEPTSKKRKSVGTTLTQQGFVERNKPKKKVERETFPTDTHFEREHRGNFFVLFRKGDVWYSGRPEFDGWAFLIDQIDFENCALVVKVHAFLKLEKTFIGQLEAAKLEHTDWVLVKKHRNLPTDGRIKLKDLSTRMTQDIPFHMHLNNRHLALRYEEDGDIVAYYVKKGKQLSSSPNNQLQPRICDCFAGGGGMSVGIRECGFFSEKSYKVDLDEHACETLRANFPDATVFKLDIRDLNEKYRRGMINLLASLVDWLPMSPPCQGFSRVNTSGGCKDIQNNNCTLACIETVRLLQPSHVTMENVPGKYYSCLQELAMSTYLVVFINERINSVLSRFPGILDEKQVSVAERTKRSYLQEFICGLLSQEYQVRLCKRLNAKNYGDPQDRERVIVFASKKGYALPSAPLPTHGNEPHLKKVVTVRDVLSDLEFIERTKDGKVWLNDGSEARGHYFKGAIVEKHEPDEELQPDMPAQTIRKKNQLVHYNRKRYATVLERARLMSFPDDYVFQGSQGVQSDQIGNAIPVRFATAIANAVKESFRLGLHEPPSS